MALLERARELERRGVDGRVGQLAVLAPCGQDRLLDGLDRDPGRHVVERARGGRSPGDLECPIDVEEHPAQPVAPGVTREDAEKRQALWWYLLLAGILMLAEETAVANRLSRREKFL